MIINNFFFVIGIPGQRGDFKRSLSSQFTSCSCNDGFLFFNDGHIFPWITSLFAPVTPAGIIKKDTYIKFGKNNTDYIHVKIYSC